MTNFKLIPVAVIMGLCAITAATPSYALDFYAGASAGRATVNDWDGNDIDDGSLSSIKEEDSDTAWKVFAGAQVASFIALEASWVDLGKATIDASASGNGDYAEGDVNASAETSGIALEALAMYPVNDSISVYGRIGLFLSDVTLKIADDSGTLLDEDAQNRDLTLGIGAKFKFAERFSVRAEWQRFQEVGGTDIGTTDIDLLTVGADVTF